MDNNKLRIQDLLIKYRQNRCNREEYEELIALAQASMNAQVIKEVMKEDWASQQSELINESKIISQPKRRNWTSVLKIAATVTILAVAAFVLFQWFSSDPISYATGNGEVLEVTLPDGSEVTLNANSILTWIPVENPEKDRLVELSGEAFFEIKKMILPSTKEEEHRGFQVKTSKMTIHVLGTSFNVAARKENTEVFLEEGLVQLNLADHADGARRMIPGDKVILDNHTGAVTEKKSEDLSSSASWVTGVLKYHDKSMEEVMRDLSVLFGVEIHCEDPELQTKKINLGVPYMDWENTRRALEMAIEVRITKAGDQYMVVRKEK